MVNYYKMALGISESIIEIWQSVLVMAFLVEHETKHYSLYKVKRPVMKENIIDIKWYKNKPNMLRTLESGVGDE